MSCGLVFGPLEFPKPPTQVVCMRGTLPAHLQPSVLGSPIAPGSVGSSVSNTALKQCGPNRTSGDGSAPRHLYSLSIALRAVDQLTPK